MSAFLNFLYTLWNQMVHAISNIRFLDILDILMIAFIVYKAIQFLKDSRAGQLVKGLGILALLYLFSARFELLSVHWVLSKVMNWGIVALAVIFQPELRRALERVGRSKVGMFGHSLVSDREKISRCIEQICTAAETMQQQKIGALIVFERQTQLGDIVNTGTVVNATASVQLVGNIFFPKSPLHDGAMIIRDGMIYAAGCILPLTANPNLSTQLGTRHRAAIGISEVSDAVVVVVSEENGMISLVQNGTIERNFNRMRLRSELYRLLVDEEGQDGHQPFYNKYLSVLSVFGGKEKADGKDRKEDSHD